MEHAGEDAGWVKSPSKSAAFPFLGLFPTGSRLFHSFQFPESFSVLVPLVWAGPQLFACSGSWVVIIINISIIIITVYSGHWFPPWPRLLRPHTHLPPPPLIERWFIGDWELLGATGSSAHAVQEEPVPVPVPAPRSGFGAGSAHRTCAASRGHQGSSSSPISHQFGANWGGFGYPRLRFAPLQ